MNEAQKREIDSLLSAIADEGVSAERIARLETLLLDQPEAQDYYASQQTLMAVLDLEYSHVGPPVLDFGANQPELARPKLAGLEPDETARVDQHAGGGQTVLFANGKLTARLCAAALAAVFFFGLVWSVRPTDTSSPPDDATTVARAWSSESSTRDDLPGLIVQDKTALRLLEKLTRHPLLTNVVLPQTDDQAAGVNPTLCSGNAWFERVRDQRERGYLVALPKGCLMEVAVDTDAGGQNSLAILELNHLGNATGKAMTFNNTHKADPTDDDTRIVTNDRAAGEIGSFTEFNDSSLTKYYLLTGSFALQGADGDEQWQQSDYAIQFDEEDLMVIGWDDSGYDGLATDADKFSPDRDFNDIRAVLKFSFPHRIGSPRLPVSPLLPETIGYADQPDDILTSDGYTLDLRPGEEALLTVSAEAKFQTGFRIVEAESGSLLWADDGIESRKNRKQPTNRGVYVVRNLTDHVQRYKLQGRHKKFLATADDPWISSPFRAFDGDNGTITIGFEDSPQSKNNCDWHDLQFYVKIFSP